MKALIPRQELATLIGKIQNIVPIKPAIPILGNVLIKAKNRKLTLSATDLTVSVSATMDAEIIEEGEIALPARRFFQLIRELMSEQIELTCKDEIAHIVSFSSHFKLNGMHKSEFPQLPNIQDGKELNFKSENLREMFVRSSFAAAKDDSRHVLNGILMQITSEQSTLIGTDGKRLAKINYPIQFEFITQKQSHYLIPLKAIEEMIKLLDLDEEAKLILMDDKIALECGSVCLITKLLSGQYPDVDRVIPKTESLSPIPIHREELMSLLRQVSLFTSDMSSSVRFVFNQGELKLQSSSSDIGEGKVSMPIDYKKETLEIAFNPHYFLDILKHCKDEVVSFSVSDPYNPGLITDSSSALFVIMPMRLSNV